MKIKFLGAAKNVTGSRFMLECAGKRLLVDCGLYQERELRFRNWKDFPVSPETIDHVILTHAHIDHSGYLPKFVRNGFKGKIFCTAPTAEITRIALLDSAKLQERDAEIKAKRHKKEKRKGPYPEVPLYTEEDAERVFSFFETCSYEEKVVISPKISVTFHDAGHILGAAMIRLSVNEEGEDKVCIFSGDIGRWGRPILRDPSVFKEADFVFMEATYGNREHETEDVSLNKLERIIIETRKVGGNIVIPAFAIERTQEVLYYLNELLIDKRISPLKIFIDSPMAIDVTEVFRKYPLFFDEKALELERSNHSPFEMPYLEISRTKEESKAINRIKTPIIIIAGSGMCTGGRIKHHLIHNIERQESTILFVGYQAKGTLGREILQQPDRIRILGRLYKLKARVEKINGFSAHADRKELLRWVSFFKKGPKKFFIIHAEEESALAFKDSLKAELNSEVIVPEYLQEYEL